MGGRNVGVAFPTSHAGFSRLLTLMLSGLELQDSEPLSPFHDVTVCRPSPITEPRVVECHMDGKMPQRCQAPLRTSVSELTFCARDNAAM